MWLCSNTEINISKCLHRVVLTPTYTKSPLFPLVTILTISLFSSSSQRCHSIRDAMHATFVFRVRKKMCLLLRERGGKRYIRIMYQRTFFSHRKNIEELLVKSNFQDVFTIWSSGWFGMNCCHFMLYSKQLFLEHIIWFQLGLVLLLFSIDRRGSFKSMTINTHHSISTLSHRTKLRSFFLFYFSSQYTKLISVSIISVSWCWHKLFSGY